MVNLPELALFAGAGGGILGTHLLGCRVVAAVERDVFARRTLIERQRDLGYQFPVWDDCRTFDGRAFRRVVDIVSAGFPCQPFSVAGKQKASEDERNGWPHAIRIIREVRPAVALLENVPGLLSKSHGYFGTVLGDLAESDFDAESCVLGASDVGARHRRKRLWILAYSVRSGEVLAQLAGVADANVGSERPNAKVFQEGKSKPCGDSGNATDSDSQRFSRGPQRDCEPIELGLESSRGDDSGGLRDHVPDTDGDVLRQQLGRRESGARETVASAQPRLGGVANGLAGRLVTPWGVEPADLPRVASGVQDRVARLRAIGNGQVPLCAAVAWRLLARRALEVIR